MGTLSILIFMRLLRKHNVLKPSEEFPSTAPEFLIYAAKEFLSIINQDSTAELKVDKDSVHLP